MAGLLKVRVEHLWQLLHGWLFPVMGVAYALFGTATCFRDNLLSPEERAKWEVLKLLPHWPISWWVTIGLAIVVLGFFEGSFRLSRKLQGDLEQVHGKLREIESTKPIVTITADGLDLRVENRGGAATFEAKWLVLEARNWPSLRPRDGR
jgi:hypothetical protein